MKKSFCLAIQGGGTRASFCLGVVLAMREAGLMADYVIGTSAGSLIGMMYLLKDTRGVEDAFIDYMGNKQFVGLSNVIKNGSLFNFSFFYEDISRNRREIDISSFLESPAKYYAVATDCEEGKPAYFSLDEGDVLRGIEASCALPLFSRPVEIGGLHYLDGGTVESLPFHKPLREGEKKIVFVSSRPKGFKKEGSGRSSKLAAKAIYGKYPKWKEAFVRSIESYNEEVDELLKAEEEGKLFAIYPEVPISLGVAETDRFRLLGAIYEGRKTFQKVLPALKEYLRQ